MYGLSSDVTYPNPDGSHGAFNALVFETLFSVAWVLVVLCVATPTADLDVEDGIENKAPQSFYGLAIGLTVAGGAPLPPTVCPVPLCHPARVTAAACPWQLSTVLASTREHPAVSSTRPSAQACVSRTLSRVAPLVHTCGSTG